MLHFVYISQIYSQKNSLEKSIVTYLKQLDRILTDDLEYLKNKILLDIGLLSKTNKRCSPIKATWTKGKDGDFTIHFETTLIKLKILKVNAGGVVSND